MLDFGPIIATGDALTNSPFHKENGYFSGTVWNQIDKTTPSLGTLVWADGTLATGVQLRVGAGVHTGVTILNFTGIALNHSTPPKTTHTGVYAGTSAGQDALFPGKPSAQALPIGVQINGLPPGRYEVYVVARNINVDLAQTQRVYVGVAKGSAGINFASAGYTSRTLAYATGTDATEEWQEGANYLKFTVTLKEGDALNIATIGEQGGRLRGFLNCVQVVSVSSGG